MPECLNSWPEIWLVVGLGTALFYSGVYIGRAFMLDSLGMTRREFLAVEKSGRNMTETPRLTGGPTNGRGTRKG